MKSRNNQTLRQAGSGSIFLALPGKPYGKELLIVLYVSPILGPITHTTAITTMATNERMIAYSTNP
jgi:hypothetical protein